LTKGETVKIGDFWLAKSIEASTGRSGQMGRIVYMSSEIVREQEHLYPADVWSLKCILYDLLNPKRTFQMSNVFAKMQKILNGQPDPTSPSYSPEFTMILQNLFSKEPLKRFLCYDLLRFSIFSHENIPQILTSTIPLANSSVADDLIYFLSDATGNRS
jgi:serine/threonine protein kinase